MPLYKSIAVNSQTDVKIWRITEPFEVLMKPLSLSENSLTRVQGMKSGIHQRGFLSVRHLLREFGYTDHDLFYDDQGKPHLKNGKFISISHSFNFSGIILSDEPVGIDIEKQRPKIKKIAKKFVDYEFDYLKEDQQEYIRQLTIIWCIKESLYKQFATPGLSFKKHTMVIPFNTTDLTTAAWIDYEEMKYKYNSHFLEFEDFSCAYVLAE